MTNIIAKAGLAVGKLIAGIVGYTIIFLLANFMTGGNHANATIVGLLMIIVLKMARGKEKSK